MASNSNTPDQTALLQDILSNLTALRQEQAQLAASVEAINARVNALAGPKQTHDGVAPNFNFGSPEIRPVSPAVVPLTHAPRGSVDLNGSSESNPPAPRKPSLISKIMLTTYPGKAGMDPIPIKWGAIDPYKRGRKWYLYLIDHQHGLLTMFYLCSYRGLSKRQFFQEEKRSRSTWRLVLDILCTSRRFASVRRRARGRLHEH